MEACVDLYRGPRAIPRQSTPVVVFSLGLGDMPGGRPVAGQLSGTPLFPGLTHLTLCVLVRVFQQAAWQEAGALLGLFWRHRSKSNIEQNAASCYLHTTVMSLLLGVRRATTRALCDGVSRRRGGGSLLVYCPSGILHIALFVPWART